MNDFFNDIKKQNRRHKLILGTSLFFNSNLYFYNVLKFRSDVFNRKSALGLSLISNNLGESGLLYFLGIKGKRNNLLSAAVGKKNYFQIDRNYDAKSYWNSSKYIVNTNFYKISYEYNLISSNLFSTLTKELFHLKQESFLYPVARI